LAMPIPSAAPVERSSGAHVERAKVWVVCRDRLRDVPTPRETAPTRPRTSSPHRVGGNRGCGGNAQPTPGVDHSCGQVNRERELGLDRRETG